MAPTTRKRSSRRAASSKGSSAVKAGRSGPRKQRVPTRKRVSNGTLRTSRAYNGTGTPTIEISQPTKRLPWQTLPYAILVQIFQYASYPLYDETTFQPTEWSRKLCKVARLCRSFAEPALTVLYGSPPLVPMDKARQIVDLLKSDPAYLALKYRQKVEILQIDVGQVAAYSMGAGLGHLDLYGMIKDLPRLKELSFYHQLDMAPYRDLDRTIKWTYPESIFDALDHIGGSTDPLRGDKTAPCRLQSWRWSSRLAGQRWPLIQIHQVHERPSFRYLRSLAFVNYHAPKVKKGESDPRSQLATSLAQAVHKLSNLENLTFESCTLLDGRLLAMLPSNLHSLGVINCPLLNAHDLASFLLTHGNQLQCLKLHHNLALSLSFLPVLANACPRLQVLRMNLTYYRALATYDDSDPDYSKLLFPNEKPQWPNSLQVLELLQLRQWDTPVAEMFLQSLLAAAGDLPDLRYINLQAILDIPWRERATFRDKWIGAMVDVFKRPLTPRNTRVTSMSDSEDDIPLIQRRKKSTAKPTRSSARTAAASSHGRASSRRESQRKFQTLNYCESSDDADSDMIEDAATLDCDTSEPTSPSTLTSQPTAAAQVIHGMCDTVLVRIDNLRPGETQFTEKDFLDDEPAEDEDPDWDEDGEEVDDGGYAW